MGLDMWLPSIFDFCDEKQVRRVAKPVTDGVKRGHFHHPMEIVQRFFDAMRATGGYYREGYNGRGLLTRLGLSWADVIDGLEDRTKLPPAHARHLLAELEARPFTKAMLFEDRRPRRSDPDMEQMMAKMMGGRIEPPAESDFSDQENDKACGEYTERRLELMALLRKAVERDEPLRISG